MSRKPGKKAVSEMIAYVLMIVIAISISIMVYAFIMSYTKIVPEECPDDTHLVIENYACYASANAKLINLSIRNQGYHNIDGFMIHINNESGKPAIYALEKSAGDNGQIFFTPSLNSSNSINYVFDYSKYNKIAVIDIKPFRAGKNILICKASINQEIDGC